MLTDALKPTQTNIRSRCKAKGGHLVADCRRSNSRFNPPLQKLQKKTVFELAEKPPYSPDLIPSDYRLFPKLKSMIFRGWTILFIVQLQMFYHHIST